MKATFSPGDKIVCIDKGSIIPLTLGKVYIAQEKTILGHNLDNMSDVYAPLVIVIDDDGNALGYYVSRFMLLSNAVAECTVPTRLQIVDLMNI